MAASSDSELQKLRAYEALSAHPRLADLVALTRVPGMTGLSWDAAFAAISSGPAEALGLGGELGSLRPGRHGDVVIWDGDPLELGTAVVQEFIDGVEQPLTNHQTRLRERYWNPPEGALPKAYQH